MLDDMFSFIDPVIEMNDGDTARLVISVEAFFDFVEKSGIDRLISSPEGTPGMPLDIAISLLKPDELEKLKKYVASYLEKHNDEET